MKYRMTLDTVANQARVTAPHTAAISLSTLFQRLHSKIPNLGLLPPVVRLITPISKNKWSAETFSVVIEQAPCVRSVYLDYNAAHVKKYNYGPNIDNQIYSLPIPWHSFILRLRLVDSHNFVLDRLYFFFQHRSLQSEFDFLNEQLFATPYLPNVITNECCLSSLTNGEAWDLSDFIGFWYNLMEKFWSTPFNLDTFTNLNWYLKNKFDLSLYYDEDNKVDYDNLKSKLHDFYTRLSALTLDQVCNENFLNFVHPGIFDYVVWDPEKKSLDPSTSLMDIFTAIGTAK